MFKPVALIPTFEKEEVMQKAISAIALVILFLGYLGCQSDRTSTAPTSRIQVTTVGSASVPKQFAEGLTFEYKDADVNPEAVLTELVNAGVPVVQAWLPLDNICMGPLGPRFTVELQQQDDRMPKFKFKEGSGRLECATTLKHYVITM